MANWRPDPILLRPHPRSARAAEPLAYVALMNPIR